ncbi:13116_t:CDS:2 [Ambispora leptoticha]|uniref:13116_t:CDS:1 n=1 Tax=Ambispora leptoticha TaxID=144679 RepID=A0A9N9C415_9GLOM|nr:13116_t:CDS:2 [Ambispora leptoticha]
MAMKQADWYGKLDNKVELPIQIGGKSIGTDSRGYRSGGVFYKATPEELKARKEGVKVENDTTLLAEFAQGMQQELAKEIISARGNENTENNNQDKSTIAP